MQINDRQKNTRSISVIAVVCAVLQIALATYIALGNGRPNFALVFCIVMALSIGGRVGVICGFAAGLFFDLASTGPVGLMACLLSLCAYVLGAETRDRYADDAMESLLPALAACLAVSLAYSFSMLFVGLSDNLLDVLVFRALPTTLLTALCYLPFAFLLGRGRKGLGTSIPGHKGSRLEVPR